MAIQEKARGVLIYSIQKENQGRKASLSKENYKQKLLHNQRGDFRNVGDGSRGLKTSVGHYKDGVLTIPSKFIHQVNHSSSSSASSSSVKHFKHSSFKKSSKKQKKKKRKHRI